MSITIEIQDGPTNKVIFECCDLDDCPHCKGSGSVKFEDPVFAVNMTNVNARAMLELLGLDYDCCGTIECDKIPSHISTAVRKLNIKHERKIACVEGIETKNFISFGRDDEYVHSKLEMIVNVLREAKRMGKNVVWG